MAFFAEYLEETGLFERWLESCPLNCTSPNAPELVDVLGTWMLSILDGHWRCAHVGVLRGVAPSILGVSLDAQLEPGNQHGPAHSRPGLTALLEVMPAEERPQLVRGDCAFGVEGEMSALEAIEQPYLFKLRQTAGVKKLAQRQWQRRDWCPAGQSWDACEDVLQLTGWTRRRPVIVMRRVRRTDLVVEVKRAGRPKRKDPAQVELHSIDENAPAKSWEYAVLVCNTHCELENIGQLYRDRADCENGFDEGKNQWGWGGCITHDIVERMLACAPKPNLGLRALRMWYLRRIG